MTLVRLFNRRTLSCAVSCALGCALAAGSLGAQAASFVFAGHSTFDTDVVQLGFSLDAGVTAVDVWTDSWQSGANFDPVLAVWQKAGSGYSFIGEVDDDDTIGPGQGAFDAGLHLGALTAGQYLITLAASPNYATGSTLAAGFALDGSAPIAIADWNQPGYDLNANDQKGTAWRLHLDGATQAALVPEPGTWALMAIGLAAVGLVGRRRRG